MVISHFVLLDMLTMYPQTILKYGVGILINTITIVSDTGAGRVCYSGTKTSVISFLLNMWLLNTLWCFNYSVVSSAKDTHRGNKFWIQYTELVNRALGRKKLNLLGYICNLYNTVYPKKYAHGFCFDVLCCGYTLTDFPISIRLTSLALWQSNDCPSASKATLMNMDKYYIWIHYERLHNHNKAKHNKTVCIFLGIYCTLTIVKCQLIWPPA